MTNTTFSRLIAALLMLTLLASCTTPSTPAVTEATSAPEATAELAAEPTAEPTVEASAAATEAPAEASSDEGAQPTGQHTYVIVPEESLASYMMNEEFFGLALGKYGIPEGLVDTVGTTSAIEGQFELNWDDLSAPLGENTFTVDLSTLESNQALRDSWIRENGPEFATYPDATFVAESIEGAPTSYTPGEEVTFKMTGPLTVRETTRPTTFDITAKLEDGTVTGTAITALKLTDFGITPPSFANTLTVSDDFQIKVDFTAQEQ